MMNPSAWLFVKGPESIRVIRASSGALTRYIGGALRVTLIGGILVAGAVACGSGTTRGAASSEEAFGEALNELPDGSYSCEVFNATRGNGPYSLDCDKFGSSITIHFDNGGYVDADIDSQTTRDGSTWDITGTNANDGEEWEITVSR